MGGPGGLIDYIDQDLIPNWLGGPKQTDTRRRPSSKVLLHVR